MVRERNNKAPVSGVYHDPFGNLALFKTRFTTETQGHRG